MANGRCGQRAAEEGPGFGLGRERSGESADQGGPGVAVIQRVSPEDRSAALEGGAVLAEPHGSFPDQLARSPDGGEDTAYMGNL